LEEQLINAPNTIKDEEEKADENENENENEN
jgi:hypothetical protein